MHEFPITEKIIKTACKACEDAGGRRVSCVYLVLGAYSGFVPESIHLYFDIISEGTPCEGAEVRIKRIKPMLKCSGCGRLFEKPYLSFSCPDCGGEGEPTEIGKECYIESIEIE